MNETARQPRPWVAVVLSLIVPGLGQAYGGSPGVGLGVWIATIGLVAVGLVGMMSFPGLLYLVPPFLWLAWFAFICWDAFRRTQRNAPSSRLPRWARWVAIVTVIVAQGILQDFLLSWTRAEMVQSFVLVSENMVPTLQPGDYVLVSRGGLPTNVGNLVTYVVPESDAEVLGRIVGTAGDTLAMRDGRLYVNGQRVDEPYITWSSSGEQTHSWMEWQAASPPAVTDAVAASTPTTRNWGPLVVPAEQVFILGDHRNSSLDSRYRGFSDVRDLVGRPARIYFSWDSEKREVRWNRLGLFPR